MSFYSKGYTLWLMPKGQLYEKLKALIKKLANENNGPAFEPHVTLLGGIELSEEEVIKRTTQLVKDQKPFYVTLKQIEYEDFYFRTLFVKAEITEFSQSLHNRAKQIFEKDIPPYMPHLSLLYGNYPVDLKERIITEIDREQRAQFEVSSIFLNKEFGEIKDWKVIKEFPFKP